MRHLKERILVAVLLVTPVAVGQSGCSVALAVQGKEEPDMSEIEVGTTRGQIELQLNAPVSSAPNTEGGVTDTYYYYTGDEPSPGRAVLHGALDVLTLFIWELIGTPIELAQGSKKAIEVDYDANDYVMAIRKVPVVQTDETATAE
ncbi:MAG: hypothetical protein KDD69_15965 [Bdellovibrionales bacterium]|nr:hypothetical protein [Bdellovibrionales bacterium]